MSSFHEEGGQQDDFGGGSAETLWGLKCSQTIWKKRFKAP